MNKLIIGLTAASLYTFSFAGARAITIEQVTRGHELIEKISAEKKALDEIKAADCDDGRSWYENLTFWIKSKPADKCDPCGTAGAASTTFSYNCVNCFGMGGDPYRHEVSLGLDRKHTIAAMQSQLDDDMAELNKLGITP